LTKFSQYLLIYLISSLWVGCVNSTPEVEPSVQPEPQAAVQDAAVQQKAPEPVIESVPVPEPAPVEVVKVVDQPAPDSCVPLRSGLEKGAPSYLPESNVVITSLVKTCSINQGTGLMADSSWMAMGFPCTAGNARMEWKGHYINPKMLAFSLGNDCAMAPKDHIEAARKVVEESGIPTSSRILAYNPFGVQYWELSDFGEADVGYMVDVRTIPSRKELWKEFTAGNQPFKIRLYGRENAWTQNDQFYEVDAEIRLTSRTTFGLHVVQVKLLDDAGKAAVKSRCEGLRPKRDCAF